MVVNVNLPLNFISALCYKETLRIGLNLGAPGIYGNFAIYTLFSALNLNGEQQKLQLGETQSIGRGIETHKIFVLFVN